MVEKKNQEEEVGDAQKKQETMLSSAIYGRSLTQLLLFTHSLINLLTHSLSLTHSLTSILTYSLTHSLRSRDMTSQSPAPSHFRSPMTQQRDPRRSSFMSTLSAPFSMFKRNNGTVSSSTPASRSFATPGYFHSGSMTNNKEMVDKQRLLQSLMDYFRDCFNIILSTSASYVLDGRVNLNKYIETIVHNLQQENYEIPGLLPHSELITLIITEILKLDHPRSYNDFVTQDTFLQLLRLHTGFYHIPQLRNEPVYSTKLFNNMSTEKTSREAYGKLLSERGVRDFSIIIPNTPNIGGVSLKQRTDFEVMKQREGVHKMERDKKLEEINEKYNDSYVNSMNNAVLNPNNIFPADPDEMDLGVDASQEGQRAPVAVRIAERLEPLNDNDYREISSILLGPPSDKLLIEKFNIDISVNKIKTLRDNSWLNDEMVNFYMKMLNERENELVVKYPIKKKSYFFNSFFVNRLVDNESGGYCYDNVKRWTKKAGIENIMEFERIFFPVNVNNTHWTLAVVYLHAKRVLYYDSMGGRGQRYVEGLLRWVVDEAAAKNKIVVNKNEWSLERGVCPQQENGYDCGVFTVVCADFLADDLPLTYEQKYMSMFRHKIGSFILKGALGYTV